jgi:hypothetical protein
MPEQPQPRGDVLTPKERKAIRSLRQYATYDEAPTQSEVELVVAIIDRLAARLAAIKVVLREMRRVANIGTPGVSETTEYWLGKITRAAAESARKEKT